MALGEKPSSTALEHSALAARSSQTAWILPLYRPTDNITISRCNSNSSSATALEHGLSSLIGTLQRDVDLEITSITTILVPFFNPMYF
jgi:hypothetical protein